MYPYVCHVIFLATMTPEGRDYLVRLNYLPLINTLLSQINEEYIKECQNSVSYGIGFPLALCFRIFVKVGSGRNRLSRSDGSNWRAFQCSR